MNKSDKLLSLLEKLSRLEHNAQPIPFFIDHLNLLFAPLHFVHEVAQPNDTRLCFPISSYSKDYGFIVASATSDMPSAVISALRSSAKLLAVVMDNITPEAVKPSASTEPAPPDKDLFDAVEHYTEEITRKNLGNRAYDVLFSDELNDSIIITQNDLIEMTNSNVEKLTGFTQKELLHTPFMDIIHVDDRDWMLERHHARLRRERSSNDRYEFRVRNKDGSILWVHMSLSMIQWEGKPATILFLHDVSEQKSAELALLNEKQFTEKLLESLPGIFFVYDAECRLKRWNKSHETSLGYSAYELQDWFIADWHETPEEKERGLAFAKQVLETGVGGSIKASLLHKDGQFIPYLISITRLITQEGPLMMGVGIDITERIQAEQELLLEKHFSEKLLESLPVLFYLYDSNGRLKRWNKLHETALGYTAEELSNWHIPDWHETPEAKEKGMALFKNVIDTGVSGSFETSLINKEGKYIPYLISQSCLQTPEGVFVMGVGTDITKRKQAESEKERLQNQLLQVQKMESVGRLAGGVAHDFNNMLQGILGNIELSLMKLPADHPIRSHLKEAQRCAQHSAGLTSQLLAFARKQTVAPKVLSLNDTVSGMLNMLRRLIGEDVELNWVPGDDLDYIKIDPTQVDQILVNLCVNSRDAMENGAGKMTIETANAAFDGAYCERHSGFKPGRYVMLAVSDDGCGMDNDTLSHLFEPFYTTKELGKGTGLGLATIYGVVKQNDGFINVYSELGTGTTFKIYLPYHPEVSSPKAEEPQITISSSDETILLVEDDPTILKNIAAMLTGMGFNVIAVDAPEKAIDIIQKRDNKVDLLLTDVIMPKMNGRELLEQIVELKPDIRSLFMSGYTSNVIARHGVLDEGVHFIQKPFSMKSLSAKIRTALDS